MLGLRRQILLCLALFLGGIGLAEAQGKTKVGMIPFVSTFPKDTPNTFFEVTQKLSRTLAAKGFEVALTSFSSAGGETSGGSDEAKGGSTPFQAEYKDGMELYEKAKGQLKKKNFEAARTSLEAALAKIEIGLVHLHDLDILLDLHRLLGLAYFQTGMNEKGEQAIQRMGSLAPTKQYPANQMMPVLMRILKSAQRQAGRATGKLELKAPEGSTVRLDAQTLEGSSTYKAKGLVPGRHYLWVKKPGFVPIGKPIEIQEKGTTSLSIDLEAAAKEQKTDLSSQTRSVGKRLVKGLLDTQVQTLCLEIAKALDVNILLLGFAQRTATAYDMTIFAYRRQDQDLKELGPMQLDLELLEVEIKIAQAAAMIKDKLAGLGSLPSRPWQTAVALAETPASSEGSSQASPPSERGSSTSGAGGAPQPSKEPKGRSEEEPEIDEFSSGRPKPPPPAERPPERPPERPIERPAEKPVERPLERRPDRPSDPAPPSDRSAEPPSSFDPPAERPAERPTERPAEQPRPEERPADRPTERPTERTSEEPKRLAQGAAPLERSSSINGGAHPTEGEKWKPGIDPDREMDWSNPIPQEARGEAPKGPSADEMLLNETEKPKTRVLPRTSLPPERQAEPPPRRVAILPPPFRRPDPPPSTPRPLVQQWWFWTIIGVGAAAVATTAVVVAIQAQPPSSYNVFVQVKPTLLVR